MDAAFLKELISSLLAVLGASVDDIAVVQNHPASPQTSSRGGRTVVKVASKDSKELIGPHGEHVRALNTIARRLAEAKYNEAAGGFLVDINGYYEEKVEVVRAHARMLAQRARLFKHNVEMSPMSPYERLVVHELFSGDSEIQTESQGEGKFRHIVLKYKQNSGSTAV